MRTLKICVTLSFCLLALLPLVAASKSGKAAALATPASSAETEPLAALQASAPDDFIGSDACSDCHSDQSAHFAMTAHRKTIRDGAPLERQGCESCHGGARKHVDYYKTAQRLVEEGKDAEAQALYADEAKAAAAKMRSFAGLSPAASSQVCLQCHEGTQGRSEERFNFRRSEHFRHGVACVDCHSSHTAKRSQFLLRESEPEGCYQCHADQKASFAKPFHHKVPEGGMKCSDCHNPHGTLQPKQLRSWAGSDVACIKCHADKAGPFVYEHAPVKVEGCQACHTPHGSTNPKMLKRNEVRMLCLECHSNTPTLPGEEAGGVPATPSFHNLALPRFQNCTVCHSAIHGSNSHPFYFR